MLLARTLFYKPLNVRFEVEWDRAELIRLMNTLE
jgi:hypothetical protein